MSYTEAPNWIKLTSDPNDVYSSFWSLARLSFPEARSQYVSSRAPIPSPRHGAVLEPNDHLLCFDYLFYAGVSLRVRSFFRIQRDRIDADSNYLHAFVLPDSHHRSSSATTRLCGSSLASTCAGRRR